MLRLGQAIRATGRLFELRSVQDADVPAARADHVLALKHMQGHGDPRPAYAEHQRQELVRELKIVAVRPVVRHEKPAGQPCLTVWRALARLVSATCVVKTCE